MRLGHKRSLFGYSSKAVEKAIAGMRAEFEKSKRELEAELAEYHRTNRIMLEEIEVRKQELADHAQLEKEFEGLLQTQQEHSKPTRRQEQPETLKQTIQIKVNG